MTRPAPEEGLHARDYLQIIRNRLPIILLTFALVFLTAVAVTHILPKEYLGRASLEIVQNDEDLNVFQSPNGAAVAELAQMNFIQTQFEIISSQQTLYRVIEENDLISKWNAGTKQNAYRILLKKLDTSARRNTNIIDIEVYADSPDEASELANAIAKSYSDRRLESEKARMDKALTALNNELEHQREVVNGLRDEMLALMRKYDVVDLDTSGRFTGLTGEAMTATPRVLEQSELDLYNNRQSIEKIRTQIEKLKNLSGDELIEQAVSLDVADVTVQELYPQYLMEQKEKEKLLNDGLGPRHPKVLSMQAQADKTRQLLEGGVENIRRTLQTQLEIAEEALTKIETLHDQKADESMTERETHVAYAEAKNEYETQRSNLQAMYEKLYQAKIDQNMTSTPIQVHEMAEPNPSPAKPNVPLNLILGGIVGLGMGIGLAFFLEYMDNSVKTLEEVENLMGVPVLAVVPEEVSILLYDGPNSPDAEAYRILRTNIEFNRRNTNANAISVTSGTPGEGKSTTLANLAYVCAQGGYTTLLIDADLRRPKLHHYLGYQNSVGLSNYLTSNVPLEEVVVRSHVDNLWFLPSGPAPEDPAGVLNSAKMTELIDEMKSRFDVVLIDSPPILGVSDASVLTNLADLTMVVIQHRKVPQKTLQRVRQSVENAGGHMIGVVLNNVDLRSDGQYQYYTSYYTYYTQPKSTSRQGKPASRRSKNQAPNSRMQPANQFELDEDDYNELY